MVDDKNDNPKKLSMEAANAAVKAASDKLTAAEKTHRETRLDLTPEQKRFADAREAVDKAGAEVREASDALVQAKANAALEHKLNRKLREGEWARRVNGNPNDNRAVNVELCSDEILKSEHETNRHISEEEMANIELAYEAKNGKSDPILAHSTDWK